MRSQKDFSVDGRVYSGRGSVREAEAQTRRAGRRKGPSGPRGGGEVWLSVSRQPSAARWSSRVSAVCMQFGVDPLPAPIQVVRDLRLSLTAGSITLISGPSGSGKSSLLGAIEQRFPRSHAVHRAAVPSDRAVVDVIGSQRELSETLSLLTACALGEPRLWLRRYDQLSEGEQFRARLAWCIDLHHQHRPGSLLLCDEFCAVLHPRAARAIAYNLRKLTSRLGLALVVVTAQEFLAGDLQPDQWVRLDGRGQVTVQRHQPRRRRFGLWRRLAVVEGGKRDYQEFSPMHYRQTDELGFVDRVFVLKEKSSGENLAIVVYSHPPLELTLRNQATGGRYKRRPDRLNREVRIIRRLVVHPDIRGCGLGHWFLRKTLPMVGVPVVECLAGMGKVNPVFEKAGMARIGECAVPANRVKILEELKQLGVGPFEPDFVAQVCRRPAVRRVVGRLVYQWYQATTGHGEQRVARQSPEFLAQCFRGLVGSQPVYYLWRRAG